MKRRQYHCVEAAPIAGFLSKMTKESWVSEEEKHRCFMLPEADCSKILQVISSEVSRVVGKDLFREEEGWRSHNSN